MGPPHQTPAKSIQIDENPAITAIPPIPKVWFLQDLSTKTAFHWLPSLPLLAMFLSSGTRTSGVNCKCYDVMTMSCLRGVSSLRNSGSLARVGSTSRATTTNASGPACCSWSPHCLNLFCESECDLLKGRTYPSLRTLNIIHNGLLQ